MTEWIATGMAVLILVYLMVTLLECIAGFRSIKRLSAQASLPDDELPMISIIFSALNEEKHIVQTLSSLAKLEYPRFEIIAVDDRSTDMTSRMLDRLQYQYVNLKIFHVRELPHGWLGKNHALHFAAQQARGDWLLFTDADVEMQTQVLGKAITYALENQLDHVTIYEHHARRNFWLDMLMLGTDIAYSIGIKPWRIRYRRSNKFLGHGAFNLINKKVYQACGGHQSIALECLDDMMLGHLVKSKGFRQDVVNGKEFVARDWYPSCHEMIKGLQKNSFAHFQFEFPRFFMSFLAAAIVFLFPLTGVCLFTGAAFQINLLNILLTVLLSMTVADEFRLSRRYALLYPLAMLLLFYALWNSVIMTYRHRGIYWRDTFYPLDALKNKETAG